MSHLQSDTSKDMQHIRGHLADMGIVDVGCEELLAIKKICKVVSTRAAKISAMALSSVITWMDPEISSRHSAAIDGTLYERYPGFRTTIKSVFGELHGPKGKRITLTRAKDGSGTGVAVVAAVAKPLR
jgi:hexokinase